jgi:hypothetical protein
MNNTKFKIGFHRAHNNFPNILNYITPVRITVIKPDIYKWLWFFIVTPEGSKSEQILNTLDNFRNLINEKLRELKLF